MRGKHALHQLFFADVALADVLDLQSGSITDLLRSRTDALSQRLGKWRVIKNADAAAVQQTAHPSCVARPRQCAHNQNTVIARQHSVHVDRVTIDQLCLHELASSAMTRHGITC